MQPVLGIDKTFEKYTFLSSGICSYVNLIVKTKQERQGTGKKLHGAGDLEGKF